MIVDSIKNGPYIRRMIATPGEPDLPVSVPESFHEQTDEELTETDIKRMDADDQAIQTILLGLPEDVYAAVDSCETAKEIRERNVGGNGQNQFGQYAGQVAQNQQWFNVWHNGGIQGAQNAGVQSGGNQNGLVVVPGIANQSGTGNVITARAEDGSAEVHLNDDYYDNKIFNMFTQEEQYTDLLEPIPEPQLVPQNDNHVTSVAPSMVQSGGTVETSSAPNEKIRAHQEIVYRNLVDQVAQVDMVNRNMRATNAELKSKLVRYKIQEQRVEISQEKYDKLEKCYQKSVYQEQCLTRKINALHLSSAKQIMTLNDKISNLNDQLSKEKSSISSLMDEKKRLKHDFKIWEDKFLDKEVDLEARIKDLKNILLKRDQTVQTMHMLNPKPDLFYHSNQKMALGYPNPSYLKKAQQKQQCLYNGNLLLEEHDPPAVYDSEETLKLAQERVFVPQTTKSKEELFLSNVSNMVTVSKMISIPNEDLSDDTTLSVARKFLNEVKSSLVTLQRVVKQKMTLEVHNWSSSAHKEVHRIISYEIAPIINQVDARVQKFKIQFLQEAAKFVRDFKSLTKEADESLDKQKSLELEIERLLKASVSHDIMSIVERLQAQLRDLKGKSSNIPSASNTLNPLNQKLELKIVELEFQVAHAKLHDLIFENAKLRARLFENTFESVKNTSGISVTPHVVKPTLSAVTPLSKKLHASMPSHSVPQPREFNVVKHKNVISPIMFKINPSQIPRRHVTVKENVNSNTITASSTGLVHTAKTRRLQPKGKTRNARIPSASKSSKFKKNVTVEEHRRTLLLSKNQKTMSSECKNIKFAIQNHKSKAICDTCEQCSVIANHDACLTPSVNVLNSRASKMCTNVPRSANQKRHRTQVWKSKQVGSKESPTPKPILPRFSLKWSPSGRSFDLKGKLVASKETNCPNDDKACTSNH
nr:hypothetical protein [Tanacetum cinerariifolium]